jgi:hypothetical protein
MSTSVSYLQQPGRRLSECWSTNTGVCSTEAQCREALMRMRWPSGWTRLRQLSSVLALVEN